MPLEHKIQPGTALEWLNTDGDGVLTLGALADAAARQGDVLDLGTSFAEVWGFELTVKPAAAPTLGQMVRLALGFSADGAVFPGGLTGADGALADPEKVVMQLRELPSLILRDVTGPQLHIGVFRPIARYVTPLVWLDAIGQALDSDDSQHTLKIFPLASVTE